MATLLDRIGITFNDVLLRPGYSDVNRDSIELSTPLTRGIHLTIPLVSSPMDTVTEHALAIALAKMGGIGIIHRNMSIQDQAQEVKRVKDHHMLVGAAIGASKGFEARIEALTEVGVDVVVIDSAHGHAHHVLDTLRYIKEHMPMLQVMAGSVATYEGACALIDAGADGLRVGMGPGAICTTRIISGMGVPQITAIMECSRAAQDTDVPVIADGGIKHSGDMVKALAAGASSVMLGSYFAACSESPGNVVELPTELVPHRFKHTIKTDRKTHPFKTYRGMGSVGAMQRGADVKSEDEFHGKSYKDRVLVAEGVESLVPIKGTLAEVVDQALGGIRSGLYYVGVRTIGELRENAQFMRVTQSSLEESHPHDIIITNAGENY